MDTEQVKTCNSCHRELPVSRFSPQKKNGVFAYYKGRCKDCYVIYRKQRADKGTPDGVRKKESNQYWKHISWL